MTKNDSTPSPEQPDPLSATGMFLRAFESNPEPTPESSNADAIKNNKDKVDPLAGSESILPLRLGDPLTSTTRAGQSAASPGKPVARGTAPGEFTQMFQRIEPQANSAPAPAAALESPIQTVNPTESAKPDSQPPGEQGPGEFTRIFVGGAKPASVPSASVAEQAEEHQRPNSPAVAASRAKGFSSPGASDSADNSFSQLFKTASPAQAPRVSVPVQSSPQVPTVQPAPPSPQISWKQEPAFKGTEASSTPSSPSATSLLNSLSSSGSSPSASRQSEPAPYRSEPVPSPGTPMEPVQPPGIDSGGVTRFIRQLSQEPPSLQPAAPPPSPAAPPINSGPGEFTRIISGMKGNTAIPTAPPPAPVQPAPIQFAAPAAPAFAAPARPAAPAFAPPAAPAFAQPAVSPPIAPQVPRPAPPAPPALAAPKGKFEALVPILLVINTFLLIVILLVVIFSMKAK